MDRIILIMDTWRGLFLLSKLTGLIGTMRVIYGKEAAFSPIPPSRRTPELHHMMKYRKNVKWTTTEEADESESRFAPTLIGKRSEVVDGLSVNAAMIAYHQMVTGNGTWSKIVREFALPPLSSANIEVCFSFWPVCLHLMHRCNNS